MYKNRSQALILSSSRGFTLIELLVVIAIIGILSAVVLASLNTARSKGNDAAIQSDLSTIQTQAEIFYGGAGGNTYTGVCAESTVAKAIAAAEVANGSGTVVCNVAANGTAYAVSSGLQAGITIGGATNMYWCVDSTGNAKSHASALGAATACP